jgi:hypothetical protein
VSLCTVAFAGDVIFDYERSANFASFATYEWVNHSAGQAASSLMDENIKRAIDSQLTVKHLRRVDSGADLQISYRAGIHQEKQFDGWGGGPRWTRPGHVTTSTIENGKRILSMVETSTGRLVWQGSVEKTLDLKSDPDKNYRNLEKAVAKLLKRYPPGTSNN